MIGVLLGISELDDPRKRAEQILRFDKTRLKKQILQTKTVIVHMDLDCFYVAVERRLNPMLRGKPVGLCQWSQQHASFHNLHYTQDRLIDTFGASTGGGPKGGGKGGPGGHNAGIIALSYEAKAAGVKRGMFLQDALRVCPDMLFVGIPTKFGKADTSFYKDAGSEVMGVLGEYGGTERVSIDEAYLDVTARSAEGFDEWVKRTSGDILASDAADRAEANATEIVGEPVEASKVKDEARLELGAGTTSTTGASTASRSSWHSRRDHIAALREELRRDFEAFCELCLTEDRLAVHGVPFFSDLKYSKEARQAAPGLLLLKDNKIGDLHKAGAAGGRQIGASLAATAASSTNTKEEQCEVKVSTTTFEAADLKAASPRLKKVKIDAEKVVPDVKKQAADDSDDDLIMFDEQGKRVDIESMTAVGKIKSSGVPPPSNPKLAKTEAQTDTTHKNASRSNGAPKPAQQKSSPLPADQDQAFFEELFEFYKLVNSMRICFEIQERVKKQLQLSCSLGVANTKCVSKIASGKHKPYKLSLVFPLGTPEFLNPLPIKDLRGYGQKLGKEICQKLSVATVGEVFAKKMRVLDEKLTHKVAQELGDACHGIDDNPVCARLLSKIVGTSKRWHTPQYLVDSNLRGWMDTLLADFVEKVAKEKTNHKRKPLQAVVSWKNVAGNDVSKTIAVEKLTKEFLLSDLLKGRDPILNLGFTAQRWVCLETGEAFKEEGGPAGGPSAHDESLFVERKCPRIGSLLNNHGFKTRTTSC
ncbi:unnamed protein product [Amoebophrya sp. A120]|nr:unnamed protein product [Amoebophrya sp. A120]|eukprot:GSA120T00011588001.1